MQVNIGDVVTYVDEHAVPHKALVTAAWGPTEWDEGDRAPSLNVVYVSKDETQTDSYGRQITRQTSVVDEKNQSAHGRYWKF